MLVVNDEAFRSAMRRALDYLEKLDRTEDAVVHLAMESGQLHVKFIHPDAFEFYGETGDSGPLAAFGVYPKPGAA